jgi:hypothetical protein
MATAKLELMPNRQGPICILAIPGMIERHLRAEGQGLRDAGSNNRLDRFLSDARWKIKDKGRKLRSKASADDQFIGTR